jgi:hypothetical protein
MAFATTNSRKLLVIGCSQTKRETQGFLPAIHRYDGSSYRVLRSFLRDHQWPRSLSVAVLSARYGLVGGFAEIEDYDERMTTERAAEWAPLCAETLGKWSGRHGSVHFSLGRDYMPAVLPAIQERVCRHTEIFEGPIGMKLSQIKTFLERTNAPEIRRATMPVAGSGKISYFLPDWDDLLDPKFDFESGSFSGSTREDRGDRHCCVLMRPKRICDGVLVSLAQQMTSKGPLKRISETAMESLAPFRLRDHFGLQKDQALFGDCGAFSYVNEVEPSISVEQAIANYELHGFDYGASVDHIPVSIVEIKGKKKVLSAAKREARVRLTIENAEQFLTLAKKRSTSFAPVGTVQGLSSESYVKTVLHYHNLGYRHIALGGLVPLSDSAISEIVRRVMPQVARLNPRPWIHLFGVFRPKLQSLFRELRVDSFDSATYFRKAWLRSDQNYLHTNGQWYAALRVPMTSDGRTRKRLEESGADIASLEIEEANVMKLLCEFDRGTGTIASVLKALIDYDEHLTRSCDARCMRNAYRRTLTDRPWKDCDCPFCRSSGIHTLIFRGANRNKRRGAHNTLMLYKSLTQAKGYIRALR